MSSMHENLGDLGINISHVDDSSPLKIAPNHLEDREDDVENIVKNDRLSTIKEVKERTGIQIKVPTIFDH